jgi:hypothetical protein
MFGREKRLMSEPGVLPIVRKARPVAILTRLESRLDWGHSVTVHGEPVARIVKMRRRAVSGSTRRIVLTTTEGGGFSPRARRHEALPAKA